MPLFFGIVALGQARGLTVAQQVKRTAKYKRTDLRFLVALCAFFDEVRDAFFKAFQVGQHQFDLDGLRVRNRINFVVDMLNVVIFETAQDVDNRVHLADVAEELVTKAFAL